MIVRHHARPIDILPVLRVAASLIALAARRNVAEQAAIKSSPFNLV